MSDKTHIGFVDAHAEGHGRDDNQTFFADKTILMLLAQFIRQAGMIRQRFMTGVGQPAGDLLGTLARQAIHNAGIAGMLVLNEVQQLSSGIITRLHAITNIRPIEAGHEQTILTTE